MFVDNFYTSPKLAEYMLDNDTHLCGTINHKRCNYSKAIVLEELEKGVVVFLQVRATPCMQASGYIKQK